MEQKRLSALLVILSLLLSIPSLTRIPRMLPVVGSNVRAAAPKALEELRSQGLWLVNTDLMNVKSGRGKICFNWEHRYRSKNIVDDPEHLSTCIYE